MLAGQKSAWHVVDSDEIWIHFEGSPIRLWTFDAARNLVKRQAREAMRQHLSQLPPGDWVVRLRAPVERQQFPSAASAALKLAVRGELASLFAAAMARRPG